MKKQDSQYLLSYVSFIVLKHIFDWRPNIAKLARDEIEAMCSGRYKIRILDAGAGTGLIGKEVMKYIIKIVWWHSTVDIGTSLGVIEVAG